jgi:Choline/Carnitine o-acyltransferase
VHFDATGKVSFDHIYAQPDPLAYFSTLREVDYRIPELAKPYFMKLIEEYRESSGIHTPNVLDIGCSYGVNAALVNCDATMDELYERYCDHGAHTRTRDGLLVSDRDLVRSRSGLRHARFVGLDSSHAALAYALAAGFIDSAVHANLEKRDPTEREHDQLAGTDLVISTGCLGYVTDKTLARVIGAQGERRPWMAHFVLRMFPFEPIAKTLTALGYETVRLDPLFRQRRFASAEEQSLVLDTLKKVGVDPRGLETDGWLYAQLHVSRPRDTSSRAVIDLASNGQHQNEHRRVENPTPSRSEMNVNSDTEWSTRTFGNEDRLPRVPLPRLADSCDKFIEWCAPLLTADELAATEAAVASFLRPASPAHTLQAALERYDRSEGVHSWLDAFWQSRYLGRRDRIALNANFFFLFKDGEQQRQVERAAGLVAGAVSYKLMLDEEKAPPIKQRGRVTSMEQDKFLFSTTRIPGLVQDTVRRPYTAEWPGPSQARHIVVFIRGNMFRMDVIGTDGRPHTLDDLEAGLHAIMKAGSLRAEPETSVGHLTTTARAEWAATRQALRAYHPRNVVALDTIETALFCLCLEDFAPQDVQEACDQLLHGDSANRWFDKSVSLVVFENGSAGINVEHCGLDGNTILNYIDTLLNTPAERHSQLSGAESQGLPAIDAIEFELDDDLQANVRAAADSFATYANNTATSTLSIKGFGANRAKQLKVSPDAFVQLSYQLAHKRAKGHLGATYESIATRTYRHGRTEAMRVVTPEVVRFVATMDDPHADAAARRTAFRAAAEKHVARAKECQAGQAPEQHLWELQLIQKRRGEELGATEPLALYDSPGWRSMRHDYLSTSAAPSFNIQYIGFGSTSSNCIGVAYVLLPESFNVYLSSPLSMADDLHHFADRLRDAVGELQDLLSTQDVAAAS